MKVKFVEIITVSIITRSDTVMVKRGELYYADLSPVVGSEQGGVRPVLVIQNDVYSLFSLSPTAEGFEVTSKRLLHLMGFDQIFFSVHWL